MLLAGSTKPERSLEEGPEEACISVMISVTLNLKERLKEKGMTVVFVKKTDISCRLSRSDTLFR